MPGELRRGASRTVVSGGVGALPGLLLAALARDLGRRLAIVVADEKEAERLAQDLRGRRSLAGVFRAPAPTLTPYQRIPPSLKARRDEFRLLAALARRLRRVRRRAAGARPSSRACPRRRRSPAVRRRSRRAKDVSLPRLTARLTELGYRRGDLVIETGDLAVRGGLFDVFPPDRELPLRVELEGDRHRFDPRLRSRHAALERAPRGGADPALRGGARVARRSATCSPQRIGRLPSEAERIVFAPAVSGHAGRLARPRGRTPCSP